MPVTFGRWSEKYFERRRGRLKRTTFVSYRSLYNYYLAPRIGARRFEEIEPGYIREISAEIRAAASAPRTANRVLNLLRNMLRFASKPGEPLEGRLLHAVIDGDEMAPNADGPGFVRHLRLFEECELIQILSDERIPEGDRALAGVLGLAGSRLGEALALRLQSIDRRRDPLPSFVINRSWDGKELTTTKTGAVLEQPIVPELLALVDRWIYGGGWEAKVGREPRPDDFIFPRRRASGALLPDDRHRINERWRAHLARIGLRYRPLIDLRPTFITLMQAAGARREIIERTTHAKPQRSGDAVWHGYSRHAWSTLCAERLLWRIEFEEPQQLAFPWELVRRNERTSSFWRVLRVRPGIAACKGEE